MFIYGVLVEWQPTSEAIIEAYRVLLSDGRMSARILALYPNTTFPWVNRHSFPVYRIQDANGDIGDEYTVIAYDSSGALVESMTVVAGAPRVYLPMVAR